MGRSILVITNPVAGHKPTGDAPALAARTLARLGNRVELYLTTGPGDAESAARRSAGSFDITVAAGGDGTVHEVANGLAGSSTALGVLPLGSMNILARELRIPFDVGRASEWIASAEPSPVTLGRRDDRYFALMAGIGFDGLSLDLALARAARARRKVGIPDYARAAWSAARRYELPPIECSSDGWTATAAFGFVANCARYGANLRIARAARLEEPLLDVVLFDAVSVPDILRFLAIVLAGRQERARGVVYRKVDHLTVRGTGDRPVPVQLDGEQSTVLPAVISAVPEALLLLRKVASG